jgi:hypothetical protein
MGERFVPEVHPTSMINWSLCLLLPLVMSAGSRRPYRVHITFVAQSDTFAAAAREYEEIWAREGDRIIAAMEEASGLTFVYPAFADTAITAIVFEGVSNSGYRDEPMHLRASYPPDTKKATLIHELGHRLQAGLFRRGEEEHGPLFLWLYDVWVKLYGQAFADAQVLIEKGRRGPYPKAWDEALALSAPERAKQWHVLVSERLPTRR